MILPASNNTLVTGSNNPGPNGTGPQSVISKSPNVSSNDLAVVSSTPSVNVSLSSTPGAVTAAVASIPPIYSKPTIYASNENQLSPSKVSSSSAALAENAVLSKPSGSTVEDTDVEDGKDTKAIDKPKTGTIIELSEDELKMVEELKLRDREVRAHEQAHKSVGGQYAGAISFSYQAGPDGKRYAVGGEVPIDVAPIAGDPQATIAKMTVVSAAAAAPAQPSAQDQIVAAQAARLISEAQAELAQNKYAESDEANESNKESSDKASSSFENTSTSNSLEKFQAIAQNDNDKVNIVDTMV